MIETDQVRGGAKLTIKIKDLAASIDPARTVLLFGSGSSVPSGGPKVADIISKIAAGFQLPETGYSLREISGLAEDKPGGRKKLIEQVRQLCSQVKPTGGLRNLALYPWKSIYTTNYDNLIEQSYALRNKTTKVISSNFDFQGDSDIRDVELFKIHGTIDKDVSDGGNSRIIITDSDYDQTEQYREYLFDRLRGDIAGPDLLIIGHSLADEDIKAVVDRAATINAKALKSANIYLLLYTTDENRAAIYEKRGLTVCFGGIDDFFLAMAPRAQLETKGKPGDLLDAVPMLRPTTVDVLHATKLGPDISAMFNGWPATYADISNGLTFSRNISDEIVKHFEGENTLCVTLLGASGVGKSTAARQAIEVMRRNGIFAWEHNPDHVLSVENWRKMADFLQASGDVGVLLVDDAHQHLRNLNDLVDHLVASDNGHLKLVIVSTRNQWYPRIKTPNIGRFGKEFRLSQLANDEIERLLNLVTQKPEIQKLVEDQFSGFNRQERRRRLVDRCQADMFVCLKNIFANDSIDTILLREFASLEENYQDIYKYVAALETSGVRVHRQLIIRLLGIPAPQIEAALSNLTDIVNEYSIDERFGIYGWRCRHPVISAIITKFKFQDLQRTIEMFDQVIDSISPTYDVEIRSLRELCTAEMGLSRIPDKEVQNRLLRKMMSNAPGERVPRHRLIRNLIDQGHFEKAETEIRLFNSDFGSDGPVHRYKIRLMIARATQSPGILHEDRVAYLEQAYELAIKGNSRYPNNKLILSAFGDLGIEYYRLTGAFEYYDEAVNELKLAEDYLADAEIGQIITRLERRIAGHYLPVEDLAVADV